MHQPHPQPIVCATDFSEPSQRAAEVAAHLARRAGTKLLLAHGIDERGEIPQNHWRRLIEEDRPRLAEEAERLRARGFTLEESLVGAAPDEGVAHYAGKMDARLIVVSSSGLGTAARWLMGSVSERIAETAAAPTLVVRDAAPLEEWLRGDRPLKVFVAADFSPVSDAALRWTRDLAEIAPCSVTVGYVDREADERGALAAHLPAGAPPAPEMYEMLMHDLREKARALFGPQNFHVHVLAASDRVDMRLLELAGEAGAELVVVGTHQWHGLSRIRHRSVSRRILHAAKVNVACVPSPTRRSDAPIPSIQRVLVATDLSPRGAPVVAHAYSLLAESGRVQLLHIAPPGASHDALLASLREFIPVEAERRQVRSNVRLMESADVAQAICDAAEEFHADVICVGTQAPGETSADGNSVAQAVIARSPRPVFVVRSSIA